MILRFGPGKNFLKEIIPRSDLIQIVSESIQIIQKVPVRVKNDVIIAGRSGKFIGQEIRKLRIPIEIVGVEVVESTQNGPSGPSQNRLLKPQFGGFGVIPLVTSGASYQGNRFIKALLMLVDEIFEILSPKSIFPLQVPLVVIDILIIQKGGTQIPFQTARPNVRQHTEGIHGEGMIVSSNLIFCH